MIPFFLSDINLLSSIDKKDYFDSICNMLLKEVDSLNIGPFHFSKSNICGELILSVEINDPTLIDGTDATCSYGYYLDKREDKIDASYFVTFYERGVHIDDYDCSFDEWKGEMSKSNNFINKEINKLSLKQKIESL